MLTADCAREAVETYGDMLYRICLVMLKNSADAEDAVQVRYRMRHQTESEEALSNYFIERSDSGIIEALMELPEKYRIVLMLHYVEEYKVDEISKIIDVSASAIKMRLSRGRKMLEEKFRKEYM